jgi:hypothetical protein
MCTILKDRKINIKEVNIEADKNTIYIDQNTIGKYIDNDSFSRQIKMLKSKDCIFVGSSFLIEDAIKMDPVFFKTYCDKLIELTDNKMVHQNNNQKSIEYEELAYSIDRVKLFRQFTRAFEEKQIYELKYYERIYPEFGKKGKYYKQINDDIESFFKENLTKDAIFSENIEKIIAIESFSFSLENLKSFCINADNSHILNIIDEICKFLTIINYGVESNDKKKIISSVQDNEHIKCATVTNYFVTADKNLSKRARFIYRILNIKTEILLLDDFLPFILKNKNIIQR